MGFLFGFATGEFSKSELQRRAAIAERFGVEFNWEAGNSGHCVCGRGCRIDRCKVKKVWFEGPNLGEPFDSGLARRVQIAVDWRAAIAERPPNSAQEKVAVRLAASGVLFSDCEILSADSYNAKVLVDESEVYIVWFNRHETISASYDKKGDCQIRRGGRERLGELARQAKIG